MKLFGSLEKDQFKDTWDARNNTELSFYGGKDPAFTPAIQGQDNGMGALSDIQHYVSMYNIFSTYEYSGWMDESSAISKTGYIGDWSWLFKIRITGPDVIKCLEQSTINGFKKYPLNRGRHIISVNDNGKLIGDGIVFHESEDAVLITTGNAMKDWIYAHSEGCDVNIEDVTSKIYNFHVQGPVSGQVIEKLTGEDISDLSFLTFKDVKIAGKNVRLYRGGMSGELGYEVFGDSLEGSVIWDAIFQAGKEFGLRQLGMRSIMLNHLQAYFPTIWVDFIPAIVPGAEALYRSPVDFGWEGVIDKTRDFPGKDALMDEISNPKTKGITLEWNNEDCIDIFASLFETENEPFEQMPLPVSMSDYSSAVEMYIPILNKDKKPIGFASNRGYSFQFRKMLALAVVDYDYSKEGTEVYILYGSEKKRQKLVRATVARTPYKADKRK